MRRVKKIAAGHDDSSHLRDGGASVDVPGIKFWINGNLRGMHLDTTAWAREKLVDDMWPRLLPESGTPELAFEALKKETKGA